MKHKIDFLVKFKQWKTKADENAGNEIKHLWFGNGMKFCESAARMKVTLRVDCIVRKF